MTKTALTPCNGPFSNVVISRLRPKLYTLFLVIGMMAVCSMPAQAETCSISSTNVAFGNVNVLPGTAVDVTASITITCTFVGAFDTIRTCTTIGSGSSSDATSRRLVGPSSATLRYDLYSDAARTQVWPRTGGVYASAVANSLGNATITLTIFARLFGSQQTATVGAYASSFTNSLAVVYDDTILAGSSCPLGGLTKTATGSFSANVTVTSACSVSATNLNFGSAGALSSNIDSTSAVSVQCTNNAPYRVALSYGTGAGAGIGGQRFMKNGATQISYNIYKDAARTSLWGDSLGVNTNDGTGSGGTQNLTAYGRVFSQTTPPPGTYTDTIVATVNY